MTEAENDTYSYDSCNNITSKTVNGKETSYIYYLANVQQKNETTLKVTIEEGVTKFYAYDEMGNMTLYKGSEQKGQNLNYTRGNMLRGGSINGNTFTYEYGPDNLRYKKWTQELWKDNPFGFEISFKVTETYYYWDGDVLVGEKSNSDYTQYLYDASGIIGMIYNGAYYYFEKNLFGDVIKAYDSNGVEVANFIYSAYGEILHKSGSMADKVHFRYRGYYYDDETGFYYLQSRYYDPSICRFISADQYELLPVLSGSLGELNLYSYCANNPIMYTDPSGESPQWWQWLINGVNTTIGIILCFVPGGQILGTGMIVSGISGLLSNTMDAMGLDSKISMQIQSGLNVIGGIGLSFIPGLGALGASMIGAGVLSFVGGYISEAFGGSYALGWGIGNIVGSVVGGLIYKGIINKLNTPANMMKSFKHHPNRWKLVNADISSATGRAYRGGISNYSRFVNIWTKGQLGTHTITVNNIVKHFHYFF